jgi:hypothetical protein
MNFRVLTTHSYYLKLLPLIVLVLTSTTLIVARLRLTSLPVIPTQVQHNDVEVEAEVVTITPAGFEPNEITRPSGRFLLAVDNARGLNEVSLYLERQTGIREKLALSRRGKLKWREIIDLPPGRYILRAANDESWRCNINLTPR